MFNRLENLPGNTVQQPDALSHGRGDPPFLLGTERAEGGLQGISHAGLSQVSFQGRVPPPPGPAPGAAPQWADARRVPSGTTQAHGPAPRQPRKWPLAQGGWRVLTAGGEERGRFLCSPLLPLRPPLPRLEVAWSREPLGALDGARGEGGGRGRGGGCCARKAMRCPWPESHTQGHPRRSGLGAHAAGPAARPLWETRIVLFLPEREFRGQTGVASRAGHSSSGPWSCCP